MPEKLEDQLANPVSIKQNLVYASYEAANFLVTRYPYLCAVMLMVTTAEELKDNKVKREDFRYIYFHLGLYFLAATVMSFDLFGLKRVFSLVTISQTAVLSYHEYNMVYGEVIMARLLTRNVAGMGAYLMVAGGISKNKGKADRNHHMVMFGRQLIGAYAMLSAMLIWNSPEEYRAYEQSLPFGRVVVYVVTLLYLACSICIYGGYGALQSCKLLSLLLFFVAITVDANSRLWYNTAKIRTWKTMTIASRQVPVIGVLMLVRKGYL